MRPIHHKAGSKATKPRNHADRIAALGGADDKVDHRVTPHALWLHWHREFRFTLDAAATPENAKCPDFYTAESNGLAQSWAGSRVWVNPPYSDIGAWVRKAWTEYDSGRTPLIVMLLPANRTEQKWWQALVEPFRDQGCLHGLRTRFLGHRICFGKPDGTHYKSAAPFGCVLLIWGTP